MQPSSYSPPYHHRPFPSPIRTAATTLPPVHRPVRRLLVVTGIAAAVLVLGLGSFLLWMKLAAHHVVLVDNANGFAVEVEVAGHKLTLAPRSSQAVKVKDGRLEVRASGPNGWSERASLDLPDAAWGRGRTVVYNVAGAGALAIITMTYGSVPGAPPPLVEISKKPSEVLQLLPPGSYGDIDEAFPSSVKSKRRGEYVRRVCHLVDDNRVGCPSS